MARWVPKPEDPVGPSEPLGRRLFDEPMLAGAEDQGPFPGIDMRHFEDREGEVSLDRCGRTGVETGVVGYLIPKAIALGNSFRKPKQFSGWLYVLAKDLTKPRGPAFPPVASPQPEPEENPYHAHVVKPEEIHDHYVMALVLRQIFASRGRKIVPRDSPAPAND